MEYYVYELIIGGKGGHYIISEGEAKLVGNNVTKSLKTLDLKLVEDKEKADEILYNMRKSFLGKNKPGKPVIKNE